MDDSGRWTSNARVGSGISVVRIVLGGAATTPRRVVEENKLVRGRPPIRAVVELAACAALWGATTLSGNCHELAVGGQRRGRAGGASDNESVATPRPAVYGLDVDSHTLQTQHLHDIGTWLSET